MADQNPGRVSIERIFGRGFGILKANAPVVFGATVLFGFLPQLIAIVLLAGLVTIGLSAGTIIAMVFIGLLVGVVPYSLMAGCITRAMIAYSQGRKAGFGECVEVAFSRVVPIFIVWILFGLAMLAGLVLIVPAVLVGVTWAVVVPVAVEEPVGIGEAFGRAASLTRGARWTILGLALLAFVIAIGISVVTSLISLPFSIASHGNPVSLIISLAAGIFEAAFWTSVQAALYVELRESKEGPIEAKLGEIFA
jgi:uncharacterized membrane protein